MSEPDSTVLFRRIRRRFNRASVRALARRLSLEVAGGRPFTCLVAGDAELRRLNRQFLGRDYPTDVLAFPVAHASAFPVAHAGYPLGACSGELKLAVVPLGDLAISVARAAAQARRLEHRLEDEIGILMLHGVLHLLGYDHERDGGRMARAEARWRRALGLPAGLTERGQP